VNKKVDSYNLQADTFSARRVICDHVNAVSGIFNVDVANKQLQVSAAGARQKYPAHLEDQRKQKTSRLYGRGNLSVMKLQLKKKQKLCTENEILKL